ncbi:hypothetical protein [Ralstonia solanacearum]|uniref:hypothetical protein n=1 Tax=Ralstonia solanacearum TaxID=305 RepID=UPI0011C43ECE|nr:hypothetical protein [Ralstonia solanacearum]
MNEQTIRDEFEDYWHSLRISAGSGALTEALKTVARKTWLTASQRYVQMAEAAIHAQADAQPVGYAVAMLGSVGFTAACFDADTAPIGSPLFLHPAPEAAQALSFADGVKAAVKWVEKRRDDYIDEFGYNDPYTGALEFGAGSHAEARREYVGELEEIVEGLNAILTRAAAQSEE